MSAKNFFIMRVAVTDGDAIETNRLKGKSNTGTYFVCSKKDWNTYSSFFSSEVRFFLDIKRIEYYQLCFVKKFFPLKEKYPDKMKHFEDICESLQAYDPCPEIHIETRINDVRIFMKFKENNDEVEYALRKIIYSDLTNIVFELNGTRCLVYPEVNLDLQANHFGD